MKALNLFLLLIVISLDSYSQDSADNPISKEFQTKLTEAKLRFLPPSDFKTVSIISDSPFKYEYAASPEGKNMEIRYSIWPISSQVLDTYEKRVKKDGDTILHPNKIHRLLAPQIFSIISGGTVQDTKVKLRAYSQANINKEFGADEGYMYMGPVGAAYSDKYKFGFFVILHKDFAGDAYISYLFPDQKTMLEQLQGIVSNNGQFKALTFSND